MAGEWQSAWSTFFAAMSRCATCGELDRRDSNVRGALPGSERKLEIDWEKYWEAGVSAAEDGAGSRWQNSRDHDDKSLARAGQAARAPPSLGRPGAVEQDIGRRPGATSQPFRC